MIFLNVVDATRAWLDLKGFHGAFTGWDADALLGLDKLDILDLVPDKETGLKLWGYLNTARRSTGNSIKSIHFEFHA